MSRKKSVRIIRAKACKLHDEHPFDGEKNGTTYNKRNARIRRS